MSRFKVGDRVICNCEKFKDEPGTVFTETHISNLWRVTLDRDQSETYVFRYTEMKLMDDVE